MESWKKLSWAECDNCGSSDVEVYSESTKEDWVYDSDTARCNECGCMGATSVGEEDDAFIRWNY
jgi:uncharacterized Zn finger protein